MSADIFAEIAAGGMGGRAELLHEPAPKAYKKIPCQLRPGKHTPIKTSKKFSTKEELYHALETLKEQYLPFLSDYAPALPAQRKTIPLDTFLLDGQPVSLPHYSGPTGTHKQTYTTEFTVAQLPSDKESMFLHFSGADYYAVVYVNDICVGTHEGFFSPFEFDITDVIYAGNNRLKIELYNDYIYMGNAFATDEKIEGDKLYAATGLGWDDPLEGWHHCPAGMGIYGEVYLEIRNRIHITDIFVRPLCEQNMAEAWIEVQNTGYETTPVTLSLSVYGQNFKETILEHMQCAPETRRIVGMGDSLTAAEWKDSTGQGIPLPAKHGKNIYRIPIDIQNPKLWSPQTPYLYQLQVTVSTADGVCDAQKQQFGMRNFAQDTSAPPYGMFYLNGNKLRLRGANTMGFEQQNILRGDVEQLIDDILLAKLCNMNFWRLTQRPVQDAVYEYCDKLGLMTQTDLPLFGCMRRTKFCEGLRQTEEMIQMVRRHPCNVIISYINEPFPNANNEPHRHLTREELEQFFTCCDTVVKLHCPEQVIKHVDGDYDPPTEGMPDNHCYPMWYNGHGIDIGKLHKGYWLPVKPDWYYGCGEYGAEGLDHASLMRSRYPKEWLCEPFNPCNIIRAQTGNFHYFFYDTQDSLDNWVEKSQEFQAFATSVMTEAFRRDDRMVSNAIHLFIDAWPSGWMKTIMDCERNPKPAYFAYRDALSPILVSLRTDRFTYYEGEPISIEAHLCNDTNIRIEGTLFFELYQDDKLILQNHTPAVLKDCTAEYCASADFTIDKVTDRERFTLKAILTDCAGRELASSSLAVEVFKAVKVPPNDSVVLIEKLSPGIHNIAGETVYVNSCGMLPVHFVSRKTGHPAVSNFQEKDFSYWYDKAEDRITPICSSTFTAKGFTPILTSGNQDASGQWVSCLVAAEKQYQGKRYVICQLDLRQENPIAQRFLKQIFEQSNETS